MKNAENVIVSKDKKSPRAGSKKSAEALLDRTEEIQAWADQIMNAKGAAQKKLRDKFKQEFGQVYNATLLNRLNIKKPEQVLINKAEDLIQQAVADESGEQEMAGSLAQVKEFQDEASVIDAERKGVVAGTIKEAAKASGLTQVLDKIFKGEPYFEEIEFESSNAPVKTNKGGGKINKTSFPNHFQQDRELRRQIKAIEIAEKEQIAAAPSDTEAEFPFPQEDPSQNIDQYASTLAQMQADELAEKQQAEDRDINESIRFSLTHGFEAETEEATQETATLDVEPDIQTTTEPEPVSLDDINKADDNGKNVPSASTEPTVEAEQESRKYFEDAVEILNSLDITSKDLDTIPGFENMNAVSQLLVAKSLKSLSLERARAKVEDDKAQAVGAKKTWVGKVFAGIGNSFRSGKMEKKAALTQLMGGIEKHGADLTRLSEWVNMFDLKEKKNEDGEPQISFINNLDLGSLNQEQFQLVSDFDDYANILADMPKHWLKKEGSVREGSQEHKQSVRYERAKQQYESLRAQLGDLMANKLDLGESFAMQELNAADAKVNMMQLMAANPDLAKEWSQMLSGSSMIKKAFAKDNWKFIAGGFLARGGVRLGLGYAFGVTVGLAALPAVAAAIGAWRAKSRARKELMSSDRFKDKKDINQSDLFTQRQVALKNLQALEPAQYVENPAVGQKLKMQREVWKQNLPAEELAKYEAALAVFKEANSAWEKEESKNTEHKVLKADDLIAKLEGLTDKYYNENEFNKYKILQDQLARRVIFSKNMADRGLVNFGSKEERTANSLKFYQLLVQAQWHVQNYQNSEATYSRTENVAQEGSDDLVERRIEIDMKKRAETLLASIEAMSETKLDSKRRAYITKQMWIGAGLGAGFATAGVLVGELTGHWVSHKMGAGFRFVKDAILNKGGAAAAVITEAAGETASSSVESTVSESAATDAVETATTATQDGSAQAAESVAESTAESAVQSSASSAGAESASTEAVTTAQQVAAEQAAPSGEGVAWVNKIDHAGDSIWRSVKEIFTDRALELGYKGDLSDTTALSRWAELQTNQTLANSGKLTEIVFIDNEVVLERSGDGFVVSVEAAEGATPAFKEVAEETVEKVITAATSGDPKIVPDATNLEALADAAGSKLGLSPEEVVATDRPNIIQTIIDGHDVFVDIVDNTYTYFNDAADEVSGMLVDGAGNPVTDLKAFLAEGLNIGDEGLLDPGAVESALANAPDLSEEGIRESADKIGLFMLERSASSIETLYNQVLTEVEEATGLESLKEIMSPKEGRIFERIVSQIHEDGYNASSHQKALSKFITRLVTRYSE